MEAEPLDHIKEQTDKLFSSTSELIRRMDYFGNSDPGGVVALVGSLFFTRSEGLKEGVLSIFSGRATTR